MIDDLDDALYAARICATRRGWRSSAPAPAKYDWNIDLAEIARIWKGGCIIRARLLDPVRKAFEAQPGLVNLLLDPAIGDDVRVRAGRLAPHGRVARRQAASPCPRTRRRSRTSTATAPRGCRRTSRRRSATPSARTPTSASTAPAPCTASGDWRLLKEGTERTKIHKRRNGANEGETEKTVMVATLVLARPPQAGVEVRGPARNHERD